jgi:hypothetical protein
MRPQSWLQPTEHSADLLSPLIMGLDRPLEAVGYCRPRSAVSKKVRGAFFGLVAPRAQGRLLGRCPRIPVLLRMLLLANLRRKRGR